MSAVLPASGRQLRVGTTRSLIGPVTFLLLTALIIGDLVLGLWHALGAGESTFARVPLVWIVTFGLGFAMAVYGAAVCRMFLERNIEIELDERGIRSRRGTKTLWELGWDRYAGCRWVVGSAFWEQWKPLSFGWQVYDVEDRRVGYLPLPGGKLELGRTTVATPLAYRRLGVMRELQRRGWVRIDDTKYFPPIAEKESMPIGIVIPQMITTVAFSTSGLLIRRPMGVVDWSLLATPAWWVAMGTFAGGVGVAWSYASLMRRDRAVMATMGGEDPKLPPPTYGRP